MPGSWTMIRVKLMIKISKIDTLSLLAVLKYIHICICDVQVCGDHKSIIVKIDEIDEQIQS